MTRLDCYPLVLLALGVPIFAAALEPEFVEMPLGAAMGNYAAVAMGDIDGDGYAEILSGRRDGEEGLVLFVYDGNDWDQRAITEDNGYGGVALADVTGDGVLDLLACVTEGRPQCLEVFEGSVAGGKMQFARRSNPFEGAKVDSLAVADIDGDGDLDIALATGGEGIQILLNDGTGDFRVLGLATNTYEDTGVALGDVNGDGRPDAVSANHAGDDLRLFLCSSEGAASYSGPFSEGLEILPGIGFGVAIADLNADGHGDIAVGRQDGVRVYLGNGCSGAEGDWWTEASLPYAGRRAMQVSAADLNGDGLPDLTFSSESGIVILPGGADWFSGRLSAGQPEKGEYSGICLADWDGDGDLDLACSSLQGNGVHLYRNVAGDR
ncbi:hypothetical protein BH23VER1_BH23VER1_04020 [soil metagenome]